MTPFTMNRRQGYAKLNIGGVCLNESSKLIKLYDSNDKCKTNRSALKELCLVRDGILIIDIDLDDDDDILCLIGFA